MQHQHEACASDLGDGSHVTCYDMSNKFIPLKLGITMISKYKTLKTSLLDLVFVEVSGSVQYSMRY